MITKAPMRRVESCRAVTTSELINSKNSLPLVKRGSVENSARPWPKWARARRISGWKMMGMATMIMMPAFCIRNLMVRSSSQSAA